jgi:formylglycine-generating enzyme required for sulfatase activity
VGRFRKFVAAWNAGWRPKAGDGKHAHLNAGNGLRSVLGGYEAGWGEAWSKELSTIPDEWNRRLACHPLYAQWTPSPGERETHPINCLDWYEKYAFCIWDGGFLPSATEWNYAAVDGSEQRPLPWSVPPDSYVLDGTYAVYCQGGGCEPDSVGSRSPRGDGRFGQADLVGNLSEMTLDMYASYPGSCDDCIQLDPISTHRIEVGTTFLGENGGRLRTVVSLDMDELARDAYWGGMRCARSPANDAGN